VNCASPIAVPGVPAPPVATTFTTSTPSATSISTDAAILSSSEASRPKDRK
jgi:hypothetical protein